MKVPRGFESHPLRSRVFEAEKSALTSAICPRAQSPLSPKSCDEICIGDPFLETPESPSEGCLLAIRRAYLRELLGLLWIEKEKGFSGFRGVDQANSAAEFGSLPGGVRRRWGRRQFLNFVRPNARAGSGGVRPASIGSTSRPEDRRRSRYRGTSKGRG